MQIHELNNYSGSIGDAYLAADNGSDTGKMKTTALTDPLNARIDNIIAGPAPSAAEIVDARLGADEETYPSLGAAIRDQVTDLKSDLSSKADKISEETGIVFSERRENTATSGSTAWVKTPIIRNIKLHKGIEYSVSATIENSLANDTFVYLDDSNNNRITSFPISAGATSSNNTFVANADYDNAYIYFQTAITTGVSVSATFDRASYPSSNLGELKESMMQHGYVFDFINNSGSLITNYNAYAFEIEANETIYVKTLESISDAFNILATFADSTTAIIIPSGHLDSKKYYSYTPTKKIVGIGYYLPSGVNNHVLICGEEKRNMDMELYSTPFNKSAFSAFAKFGVVGDSLSVGFMDDSQGVEHGRNIYYSWGQNIARRNGNKCLNFGFSGATTKTWYSSPTHGKVELIVPDNLCQCYIVGLGANDSVDATNVGTSADIDLSDFTQNADTFYGNYAKVLQLILDIAPNAYVFAFTLPTLYASDIKNNAIRGVITALNNDRLFLVDLEADYKYLFTSDYIANNVTGAHYNAVGYANIASANEYAITDVMNKNHALFIDLAFVPYGNNDVIS